MCLYDLAPIVSEGAKPFMNNIFSNKTLLITGGTGSFGEAVLKRFLYTDIGEIRIFSRDEKKQDDLRKKYSSNKLRFYLGDVRDKQSIEPALRGVDFVFHAAALKQVPSCEFHPMQAVLTNIIGTSNVLEACISAGVRKVVCLSTDKAVYPINAMGISKAMMEKVMVASSRNLERTNTTICGTRYGNVMASRGSVIPLFLNQLNNNEPITITNPKMTRFMMTLDDAVDLVLFAFENGNNGDLFVQKAPASNVETLANAILELTQKTEHEVQIIGTRHGEKLYESLLGKEEMAFAEDMGNYYRIKPDNRDLNYDQFFEIGSSNISSAIEGEEYNSNNTKQLNIEEMKTLLLKLPEIKSLLEK